MKREFVRGILASILAGALAAWAAGCSRPTSESGTGGLPSAGRTRAAGRVTRPTGLQVEVALAFAKEVAAKQYDAAYGRLSPRSRESVPKAQWSAVLARPLGISGEESLFYTVLGAEDYSVDAVQVAGERGVATVSLQGAEPVLICLIREGGQWWIDWTDEGQAREKLEEDLSALTGPATEWLATAGMMGEASMNSLARLSSGAFQDCQAVSCVEDRDRAVVKIAGTGTVQATVPLSKASAGWVAHWESATLVTGAPTEAMQEQLAATACLSNLKQLALATLMYAQDYDEHLPSADRWSDVLLPYLKNEKVFQCPADEKHEHGYAFNQALSGRKLAQIPRPAETPLLFDSTAGRKNAADDGKTWPATPRHEGTNNCAFVDGHAKAFPEKPNFKPQ